jgi:thiol-disulfide isomerase/thioredoxin
MLNKIFFLFFCLLFTAKNVSAEELSIGDNVILVAKTNHNKIFNLQENKGKVIIVNFWTNWCVFCRREILALDKIYQENENNNFEIIGINIDEKKEQKKSLKIARNLGYQNVIFDEIIESNFEYPESIPATYFIDKNGKIKEIIIGGSEDVESSVIKIKNILEKILKIK